jgi:transposase-like protein
MRERLLMVACPRCGNAGFLEMGLKLLQPQEQRWRCRWCGQPNRVTADTQVIRAFKRANTPSGMLGLSDRWQRGYLREPVRP